MTPHMLRKGEDMGQYACTVQRTSRLLVLPRQGTGHMRYIRWMGVLLRALCLSLQKFEAVGKTMSPQQMNNEQKQGAQRPA